MFIFFFFLLRFILFFFIFFFHTYKCIFILFLFNFSIFFFINFIKDDTNINVININNSIKCVNITYYNIFYYIMCDIQKFLYFCLPLWYKKYIIKYLYNKYIFFFIYLIGFFYLLGISFSIWLINYTFLLFCKFIIKFFFLFFMLILYFNITHSKWVEYHNIIKEFTLVLSQNIWWDEKTGKWNFSLLDMFLGSFGYHIIHGHIHPNILFDPKYLRKNFLICTTVACTMNAWNYYGYSNRTNMFYHKHYINNSKLSGLSPSKYLLVEENKKILANNKEAPLFVDISKAEQESNAKVCNIVIPPCKDKE